MQISAFSYLLQLPLQKFINMNALNFAFGCELESFSKSSVLTKEIADLTYQSSNDMFSLLQELVITIIDDQVLLCCKYFFKLSSIIDVLSNEFEDLLCITGGFIESFSSVNHK